MSSDLKKIVEKEFQLTVLELKKLNGYSNINYLVRTENSSFVLKTYLPEEDLIAILEGETQILAQLSQGNGTLYPKPIPFADDSYHKSINIDGKPMLCRMLSFLEGTFLAEVPVSKEAYASLGTALAEMDKELSSLKSYPIQT